MSLVNNKLLKMKKTLILFALVAASVSANTSIKHRLGQVKAKALAQMDDDNQGAGEACPCDSAFTLPPPGQGVFNGWGQAA